MSDEQVLFRGSPSLILKFGSLFLAGLMLIGSMVGAVMWRQHAVWFFIPIGCLIIFILGQILAVRARVYEMTSERIRMINGIGTKRTDELELYRVKDVTLIEPFLYRLFSLGNIVITTSDTSTPLLKVEAIRGAKELREELRKCIEACRLKKGVRVTEFE